MSKTEIKKRHVRDVNIRPMKAPRNQPKTEVRTLKWHEVPKWQVDSIYIFSGYRPANADYLEVFSSLTFLHNETYNVYTHLIGALLLPLIACATMRVLSDPQFLNVLVIDYVMFGLYFVVAEACLIFSTTYHLMQDHSQKVKEFWHGMDLLGIVIVTVGTFVSGIYYIFICEPRLQKVHWAIVSPSQQLPLLTLNADMSPRS